MFRTKTFRLLALLAVAIIPTSKLFAEPPFAVLVPLSGGFAPTGEDVKRGFELAQSQSPEFSSKEMFQYEDTRADVKTSLSIYEQLVSNQSRPLATYAIRSPIGLALNIVTRRDRMPLLGGVAHIKFTLENEFAFGIWSTSVQEGYLLADKLIEKKIADRICMVTAMDDFLVAVSGAFKEKLISSDKPPIFDEEIDPTELDLRPLLTKIKQKDCSALFINLTMAQYAPALKRTYEAKLPVPKFGNYWLQKPEVLEAAGKNSGEGVSFVETKIDRPEFLQAYQQKFGDNRPTSASFSGFVAGTMMLETLKNNPEIKTSPEFYRALLKVTEINGLGYHLAVKKRLVDIPLVLSTIKDGKVVN